MEGFDLSKYLDVALKRKYLIIISFLVSLLCGMTYTLIVPKMYEAKTLILVQPQKVPADFVRAIISVDIDARLQTISQQVTSRTNLEKIIVEQKLYQGMGGDFTSEDRVEVMRRMIKIDVSKGTGRHAEASAFTIAFRGVDPETVKKVTDTLASNFMSENLLIRESQAIGTSVFLADELETVRRRLIEKEEKLKEYRQQNMGSLPEQLASNISNLQRFQMQLDQLSRNTADAENRKLVIQKQLADAELLQRQMSDLSPGASADALSVPSMGQDRPGPSSDIASLKRQLGQLEAKYTANHPDVIRLKKTIEKMEADQAEAKTAEPEPSSPPTAPRGQRQTLPRQANPVETLRGQLMQVELEIAGLKNEMKNVHSRMETYQARVEGTPKREQELLTLSRDYENLKDLYSSMLKRKLEADIGVSMEKKQQGEQFRIIDAAKRPIRPVEPDLKRILLLTLALGLGVGGGLAYLLEMVDTSFKSPDEAEKGLHLPILVSIPIRYAESELRRQKRREIIIATSIAVGFVLTATGIVLSLKGLGTTVSYLKNLVGT